MPLTLPNLITMGRLLLALGVFGLLLWEWGGRTAALWGAFVLFVVASATDYWDGYFARRRNQVTAFGRVADPLVDKILVCGTMVLLALRPRARHLGLDGWVAGIVLAREIGVAALRSWMEHKGIPFPASWAGKVKLFLQAVTVGAVLFGLVHPPEHPALVWGCRALVWSMVSATLYSGILYATQAARHRSNPAGPT